jgi:RNA polymerase sigma factor (sigma-70 family)
LEATDAEVVAEALAGRNPLAFADLVRRHQARIRSWLRQLTRDRAAADDIAQDAFIAAWEKLHCFDGRGTFGAWLMKIAYNQFLMAHRSLRSQRRLAAAVERESAAIESHDPCGEHSAIADLERLLAILNDGERAVMILCYAHSMSHGEASEVTGMPIGTVKSHLARGREKIRARFFAEETTT